MEWPICRRATCDYPVMSEYPSRRAFVELSAGAAVAILTPACSRHDTPAPSATHPVTVRVASVPTAVEGDLLPELVRDFAPRVRALQAHLLATATQARIRATRYPTDERICWVPAGRHNRTAMLPLT